MPEEEYEEKQLLRVYLLKNIHKLKWVSQFSEVRFNSGAVFVRDRRQPTGNAELIMIYKYNKCSLNNIESTETTS
jgi:hypothetical protein